MIFTPAPSNSDYAPTGQNPQSNKGISPMPRIVRDKDHRLKGFAVHLKLLLTAALLLSTGGAATAHPKLLSANPAANATVPAPPRIALRFSEKLVPAFSKAELTMAAMPGMRAMKMAAATAVAADGKTLVVTPKSRLARGRYTIDWRVVSSDTHKVAGRYAFAVR